MKLVFLGTSCAIVYYMRYHRIIRLTYDKDQDTFRHWMLIAPSAALALIFAHPRSFLEVGLGGLTIGTHTQLATKRRTPVQIRNSSSMASSIPSGAGGTGWQAVRCCAAAAAGLVALAAETACPGVGLVCVGWLAVHELCWQQEVRCSTSVSHIAKRLQLL